MCGDGTCIPLSQRCDWTEYHCADGSDEFDCRTLRLVACFTVLQSRWRTYCDPENFVVSVQFVSSLIRHGGVLHSLKKLTDSQHTLLHVTGKYNENTRTKSRWALSPVKIEFHEGQYWIKRISFMRGMKDSRRVREWKWSHSHMYVCVSGLQTWRLITKIEDWASSANWLKINTDK